MTVAIDQHEAHGATFESRSFGEIVAHYGRPDRAHLAVRNGVGVIEMAYDLIEVRGDDRIEFVDNVVSNAVPATEGEGVYGLLLDPQGGIDLELYIFTADDRLLCFVPPGKGESLAEEWTGKTFIQDVTISPVSDSYVVFGVHGPSATEKIASVLSTGSPTPNQLTFTRGKIGDHGVTIIRTDDLTGEEGYEIVCEAENASTILEVLLTQGVNAIPFGYDTYNTLTLEAGTPLFETELRGTIPNVAGIRNALDFEKGCYVGQEIVSRIENRGRPPERLVGLQCPDIPAQDAAVFEGDSHLGTVTRAAMSPSLDHPLAMAYVSYEYTESTVAIRIDGEDVNASVVKLPAVEGSSNSARIPTYPE